MRVDLQIIFLPRTRADERSPRPPSRLGVVLFPQNERTEASAFGSCSTTSSPVQTPSSGVVSAPEPKRELFDRDGGSDDRREAGDGASGLRSLARPERLSPGVGRC